MKIVILDGYTLNPGDLDWSELESLGDLTVYDRTQPEDVHARIEKAQAVFTNKVVLDRPVLERLDSLRFIGVLATGYNVVDTKAARERNIPVANIPSYSTDSVAQWTIAHLLNMTSRIAESTEAVRNGDWTTSPDFCFWRGPLIELSGKTFGIIGFGSIGRRVATIARALGMNVLAYGPRLKPGQLIDGVETVDFEAILASSDFLSLHCPLTSDNRGMINADTLAKMKPGAMLINTSRGPLLNERDVAEALNSGRLRGLAADVLSTEPPPPDNVLLSAKNTYFTPHNAWATREARLRLMGIAADNLRAFQSGKPKNIVN